MAEKDPEIENEHEDLDDGPQNVLKTGYMTKQGGSVKNWKKRWFVLTDKYLKYYKNEKIQGVQPIGVLFLRTVSKIDRGVEGPSGMIDAFSLSTPDRVYVFACQNDREVRAWIDAIKTIVKPTGKVADVIKSGVMIKQGGSVKNWKKRYFKLRSDKLLYYYKDDKEPLAVGTIDLETCTSIVGVPMVKHNRPNTFEIVTPGRVYPLQCPDREAMMEWVSGISELTGLQYEILESHEAGDDTSALDTSAQGMEDAPAQATTPVASGDDDEGVADQLNATGLSEPSIKEGWLTKQGGAIKTWKKRWFVLRSSSLSYYKEQKDTVPQGTIDLTTCLSCGPSTKKVSKGFLFDVTTQPRVYVANAATEEEMQDWIDAIQGVLDTLPRPAVAGGAGDDEGDDNF
jgi:hypothetical protein